MLLSLLALGASAMNLERPPFPGPGPHPHPPPEDELERPYPGPHPGPHGPHPPMEDQWHPRGPPPPRPGPDGPPQPANPPPPPPANPPPPPPHGRPSHKPDEPNDHHHDGPHHKPDGPHKPDHRPDHKPDAPHHHDGPDKPHHHHEKHMAEHNFRRHAEAFRRQNYTMMTETYAHHAVIKVYNSHNGQKVEFKGHRGVKDFFFFLWNTLDEGQSFKQNELNLVEGEKDVEPPSIFLVWEAPAKGYNGGADTMILEHKEGKVVRQNVYFEYKSPTRHHHAPHHDGPGHGPHHDGPGHDGPRLEEDIVAPWA